MRVAILGANGQLGTDLRVALASHQVLPYTRADFDVRDSTAVRAILAAARPDVVINTTAFHKVDLCETEADTAFAVNALAPYALSRLSRELGFKLVHYSTDYVYGGTEVKPLTEDVPPAPLQVYGASKAAGEWLVLNTNPDALVIRSSGLYGVTGAGGKGGNFVTTVLRLAQEQGRMRIVNDQRTVPSFTQDLARGVVELIERGAAGIVHLTNSGSCTWYEFAVFIVKAAGLNAEVAPQTSAESGSPARRPPYSVLENRRLQEFGIHPLRPWQEAVSDFLRQKGVLPA